MTGDASVWESQCAADDPCLAADLEAAPKIIPVAGFLWACSISSLDLCAR